MKAISARLRNTALSIFCFCAGIVLVVVALAKTMPLPYPIWRRLAVLAIGLFFIYCGSMYYFPKNRQLREELKQDLDQLERELDAYDRESKQQ